MDTKTSPALTPMQFAILNNINLRHTMTLPDYQRHLEGMSHLLTGTPMHEPIARAYQALRSCEAQLELCLHQEETE